MAAKEGNTIQRNIYRAIWNHRYAEAEKLIKKHIKSHPSGIDLNLTFQAAGVRQGGSNILLAKVLSDPTLSRLRKSGLADLLIEKGANVNYEYQTVHANGQKTSGTLLTKMIINGSREAIELLLEKGADPNAGKTITPLSSIMRRNDRGASYKNREVMQTLKQYKADFEKINKPDGSQMSLLHMAIISSEEKNLVQVLLSKEIGIHPDVEASLKVLTGTISQATPLQQVALLGYSSQHIIQLLAAGANPLKQDSLGNTALHLAAGVDEDYLNKTSDSSAIQTHQKGNAYIGQFSIEEERVKATAFKLEGHRGRIMEYLINALPDQSVLNTLVNQKGNTVLHQVIHAALHPLPLYSDDAKSTRNSSKVMIKKLIWAGARADIKNNEGKTALELASGEIKQVLEHELSKVQKRTEKVNQRLLGKLPFFSTPTIGEKQRSAVTPIEGQTAFFKPTRLKG